MSAFQLDSRAGREAKQLEWLDRRFPAGNPPRHLFAQANDFPPTARVEPISEHGIERMRMVLVALLLIVMAGINWMWFRTIPQCLTSG